MPSSDNKRRFVNPLTQPSTAPSEPASPSTLPSTFPATLLSTESSTLPETSTFTSTYTGNRAGTRKRGKQAFEQTHTRETHWFDKELYARFEALVAEQGTAKSTLINEALAMLLEKYER